MSLRRPKICWPLAVHNAILESPLLSPQRVKSHPTWSMPVTKRACARDTSNLANPQHEAASLPATTANSWTEASLYSQALSIELQASRKGASGPSLLLAPAKPLRCLADPFLPNLGSYARVISEPIYPSAYLPAHPRVIEQLGGAPAQLRDQTPILGAPYYSAFYF